MAESLRDRKRSETMKRIQAAAIERFSKHGFAATTVEDIARDASVGPATVYRLFATKERIVIWDEYDEGFMDMMHAVIATHGLGAALKALCREVDDDMTDEQVHRIRARNRLVEQEPALQKEYVATTNEIARMVASALAARGRRHAPGTGDVAVGHVVAGLFHALMAEWAREDRNGQSFEFLLREALASIQEELF